MKKIQFYLRFHTRYGQSLYVSGNINALGNNDISKAFPLKYLNEECWYGKIDAPASTNQISYSYFLKNSDGTVVEELGNDKLINFDKGSAEEYQAIDVWN